MFYARLRDTETLQNLGINGEKTCINNGILARTCRFRPVRCFTYAYPGAVSKQNMDAASPGYWPKVGDLCQVMFKHDGINHSVI